MNRILDSTEQPSLPFGWDEPSLLSAAVGLGAGKVKGWDDVERALVKIGPPVDASVITKLQNEILEGHDPLGEIFCDLRSPQTRRSMGATYTPQGIVDAMVCHARKTGVPQRVVDPGCGSARFLVAAGRAFPEAELIGVEIDPTAAVIARGHLAATGLADRSRVILGDFRDLKPAIPKKPTLYLGNPPYVRHHLIDQTWKEWLSREAKRLGLKASQLAGLHVHFFLATALSASSGDRGAFITAAEWLDVNYGSLVRELLLERLGVDAITLIDPAAQPFPDAAATGVITHFTVGAKPAKVGFSRVSSVEEIGSAESLPRLVRRERLASEARWTLLSREAKAIPSDFIELGELCRVHRGAVTGANRVWVENEHTIHLPDKVLYRSVTKARDLIEAGCELTDPLVLKRVVDLPHDLDDLSAEERKAVEIFLAWAKTQGADTSFVAQNRKSWYSVSLRTAAPILATYMARRAPAFVRNAAEARHINVAHGLYPRDALSESTLRHLVSYLGHAVDVGAGRTYAGGLTKFEPREMERIPVPRPELLGDYASA